MLRQALTLVRIVKKTVQCWRIVSSRDTFIFRAGLKDVSGEGEVVIVSILSGQYPTSREKNPAVAP